MIIAKKSLGQNFLTDRNVLEKIVNVADIKNKIILEVGPGTGNLTSFILKRKPKKVFVIEKDEDLARNLNENFGEQLTIINDDILNIDENSLFNEKVLVFGNLPYNISTEILSKWIINLKDNFWFDHLILMFQKEVAERIISNFNKSTYGRLSILANWKLDINKICDIKPNSFSPKPKIDSSLLIFTPKKNFFKIKDPKNLEKVTRIFFSQRRKMLKKPFNQLFNGDSKISDKLKIDLNLRPQNLDFDTYYKLTSEFEKLSS
ncbi:16S rRNA (adenine(1518)-N(6)/adenine(1519)-N(6))-dimethyltransferase RsmA [Candidatus Pelagibacter sp.]|nr:16S rRNA (adenine(1518)-N(6)/adenine(1519)-N(6))-dimethyltransferase RsmA [Candidatus Pelagibacter sp.]